MIKVTQFSTLFAFCMIGIVCTSDCKTRIQSIQTQRPECMFSKDETVPHIIRKFPGSVFAIGDLHGDVNQTYQALRLIGAIDESNKWIGQCMVVVQTGDQIDRGDDDKNVLDELERLSGEAHSKGSQLILLNGNHELMNAQLDLRYTTQKANLAFTTFTDFTNINQSKILIDTPPFLTTVLELLKDKDHLHFANRAAAFAPGADYANRLAKHSFYAIVNDSIFVHGGILPTHVNYGLEKMNLELFEFFTKAKVPSVVVIGDRGPFWLRDYSSPPDSQISDNNCKLVDKALEQLGLKRMIVGHTIQKTINPGCDAKVWRIDVGMSKAYGNHAVEVLEINDQTIKIHKTVKK